jgi:hypothetical protein
MSAVTIMLFTRTVKFVHARNIPVDTTVTCSVWLSSGPVGSAVVSMDFYHQLSLAVDWIAIAIQSLEDSLTILARILAVTYTAVVAFDVVASTPAFR